MINFSPIPEHETLCVFDFLRGELRGELRDALRNERACQQS